jgi:hypothetical protein
VARRPDTKIPVNAWADYAHSFLAKLLQLHGHGEP